MDACSSMSNRVAGTGTDGGRKWLTRAPMMFVEALTGMPLTTGPAGTSAGGQAIPRSAFSRVAVIALCLLAVYSSAGPFWAKFQRHKGWHQWHPKSFKTRNGSEKNRSKISQVTIQKNSLPTWLFSAFNGGCSSRSLLAKEVCTRTWPGVCLRFQSAWPTLMTHNIS